MKRDAFLSIPAVILSASLLTACVPTGQHPAQQSGKPSSVPSASQVLSNGSVLADLPLADISKLSVLADIGGMQVKQGESYSVTGENLVQDWISVERQGDEWTIRYQPPTPDDVKGLDTSTHFFTITLPPQHALKEAAFHAGTGDVSIENFSTQLLTVSQGTGEIFLSNVHVEDLIAECGTGSFQGSQVVAERSSEFRVGTGEITLSGDLAGRILLEGGTGAVAWNLVQPKENYTVTGGSFVRSILLDGEAMEHQGEEWEYDKEPTGGEMPSRPSQKPNGGGQHTIQIEGGVGTVSIRFAVTQ